MTNLRGQVPFCLFAGGQVSDVVALAVIGYLSALATWKQPRLYRFLRNQCLDGRVNPKFGLTSPSDGAHLGGNFDGN